MWVRNLLQAFFVRFTINSLKVDSIIHSLDVEIFPGLQIFHKLLMQKRDMLYLF